MGFPGGSDGKKMLKSRLWSLGWGDPWEKGMTTHSSILAWRIPWTEEPGGLYSPRGCKESDMTEWLTLTNCRWYHTVFHRAQCPLGSCMLLQDIITFFLNGQVSFHCVCVCVYTHMHTSFLPIHLRYQVYLSDVHLGCFHWGACIFLN